VQTILRAGGTIGVELARLLPQYTDKVRLVSRIPQKVMGNEELLSADLIKPGDAMKAVEGSTVVYLTVGLPYYTKIWRKDWPVVMTNVIATSKQHNSQLVFFDNIYMYNP
jgi:predicted dinucleotide-binding enzyme